MLVWQHTSCNWNLPGQMLPLPDASGSIICISVFCFSATVAILRNSKATWRRQRWHHRISNSIFLFSAIRPMAFSLLPLFGTRCWGNPPEMRNTNITPRVISFIVFVSCSAALGPMLAAIVCPSWAGGPIETPVLTFFIVHTHRHPRSCQIRIGLKTQQVIW